MISHILDIDFGALLTDIHNERSIGRFSTPGRYHCSEIVNYLVNQIEPGKYGAPEIEGEFTAEDKLRMHFGFVIEDLFALVLRAHFKIEQVYTDLDDIEMSLDGIDPKRQAVLEVKSTKISSKHPISSAAFWPWRVRSMAYCKAVGVRKVIFIIFHINGRYDMGGGRFGNYTPIAHEIEFTQHEIDENWRMILRTRASMIEEGVRPQYEAL